MPKDILVSQAAIAIGVAWLLAMMLGLLGSNQVAVIGSTVFSDLPPASRPLGSGAVTSHSGQ